MITAPPSAFKTKHPILNYYHTVKLNFKQLKNTLSLVLYNLIFIRRLILLNELFYGDYEWIVEFEKSKVISKEKRKVH